MRTAVRFIEVSEYRRVSTLATICAQNWGLNSFFFGQNYGNFSLARPFLDFDCIFLSDLFLNVGPDKIYARTYERRESITDARVRSPCKSPAAIVAEVPDFEILIGPIQF